MTLGRPGRGCVFLLVHEMIWFKSGIDRRSQYMLNSTGWQIKQRRHGTLKLLGPLSFR